ncbi:Broad-Complex [Fragilaria crotonensis]|nr:Broad-Complex [Fragilaria crotonensis]
MAYNLKKAKRHRTSVARANWSDDDEIEDEIEQTPSWRLDPEESLSDWTMIIRQNTQYTMYHVHKASLAVGPGKSEYFASLFRLQMKENTSNTSIIALEDAAAHAVPLMLDFLYTQKLGSISAKEAVPLRYLAEYFGIKRLQQLVRSFIKQDISMTNVHDYYQSANEFHDEKLLSLIKQSCIYDIYSMDPTSPFLSCVEPQFFYDIISSPDIDTVSFRTSGRASMLVAAHCQTNTNKITKELFDKMTNEQCIPVIDNSCTLSLLASAVERHPTTAMSQNTAGTMDQSNTTASSSSVLQERCIKLLAQQWKRLDGNKILPILCTFPPAVVAEIYTQTLSLLQTKVKGYR